MPPSRSGGILVIELHEEVRTDLGRVHCTCGKWESVSRAEQFEHAADELRKIARLTKWKNTSMTGSPKRPNGGETHMQVLVSKLPAASLVLGGGWRWMPHLERWSDMRSVEWLCFQFALHAPD